MSKELINDFNTPDEMEINEFDKPSVNEETYKAKEQDTIDFVNDIRKKIVNNMVDGGIPKGARDIEVLNNVLGSLEDSQHKQATMRVRAKANVDNNNNTVELIKALSDQLSKEREKQLNNNFNVGIKLELPDSFIPTDMVFEETSDVKKNNLLDVNDFMPKG